MIDGTYFIGFNHPEFIHHIVNNSVVLLFFWDLFLGMGLLPRSLVGWDAAYLVPHFPKTLHSSEKFPAPWIIQVFDALFDQSIYRLRWLPALPSFAGRVVDEAASPLLFLLSPVRLASSRVVYFRKKVLPHLHKYFQQFTYTQRYLQPFLKKWSCNQNPKNTLA